MWFYTHFSGREIYDIFVVHDSDICLTFGRGLLHLVFTCLEALNLDHTI